MHKHVTVMRKNERMHQFNLQSNLMYSRTKEYIRNKTLDIIRNKKQ